MFFPIFDFLFPVQKSPKNVKKTFLGFSPPTFVTMQYVGVVQILGREFFLNTSTKVNLIFKRF